MKTNKKQMQIGRKTWYGLAIILSVLVILVSVAGVVGSWVGGSTLSAATVQVLLVVEGTADNMSTLVDGIDLRVAGLEETSLAIRDATDQLSQNVTEKGLVLTLLPEAREQKLVDQAQGLQQNINAVGNTLRAGLELYQSIDSLPLISLPKPEQQTINQLEQDISEIQDSVQQVSLGIQAFRDGVSGEIERVTSLLDEITAKITESRQNLEQLNSRLQALHDLAASIRSKVTLVFNSLSAIITLFLAWVIYTQVEIIRSYIRRWKGLEPETVTAIPADRSTESDSPDVSEVEVQEGDAASQE
jgi:methyl-accepting chemotaxis protein